MDKHNNSTLEPATFGESFNDVVNHPEHYQLMNNVEVIDIIKSVLGPDGYISYCYGNIIKYVLRANKKNGIEDLKKARVYLNWLIEQKEKEVK